MLKLIFLLGLTATIISTSQANYAADKYLVDRIFESRQTIKLTDALNQVEEKVKNVIITRLVDINDIIEKQPIVSRDLFYDLLCAARSKTTELNARTSTKPYIWKSRKGDRSIVRSADGETWSNLVNGVEKSTYYFLKTDNTGVVLYDAFDDSFIKLDNNNLFTGRYPNDISKVGEEGSWQRDRPPVTELKASDDSKANRNFLWKGTAQDIEFSNDKKSQTWIETRKGRRAGTYLFIQIKNGEVILYDEGNDKYFKLSDVSLTKGDSFTNINGEPVQGSWINKPALDE